VHEGHSIKELVLRGAELQLQTPLKKQGRRRPPVIDCEKRGSLDLNHAQIYEIIPFP
jgi:hypothetical protein